MVEHILCPSYSPKSNGSCERFVQTFKSSMRKMYETSKDVDLNVASFLLSYRNTPHSVTNQAPAMLLCGRMLRSKLNCILPSETATYHLPSETATLHGTTYLHWIPGHYNIPGNEYADQAAKEAAQLPDLSQGQSTISYGVARAVAKAYIKDSEPQHHLVSKTYKGYNRKRADSKIESRKDGALLAQLRAGHCLHLSHYKNRIDSTKSATCPRCGEEEETVPHWIRCPATIRTREEIFGKSDLNLDILTTNPIEILAFAKKTLLEGPLDA